MKRLITLLSLVLITGFVYLIGWSPVLTVSSVTIKTSDPKNVSLILGQLESSGLGIDVGDPLARINARAIERSLRDQNWIGEVSFERNWISGEVRLFVREKSPRFILREVGLLSPERQVRFMTESGALFTLPGDLSNEYLGLPAVELRGSDPIDRAAAVDLFDVVDPLFPTNLIVVTPLSTFITESEIKRPGSDQSRSVRITWGGFEDIETKLIVVAELTELKANRMAQRIDVSNPQLPIVSNRQQ